MKIRISHHSLRNPGCTLAFDSLSYCDFPDHLLLATSHSHSEALSPPHSLETRARKAPATIAPATSSTKIHPSYRRTIGTTYPQSHKVFDSTYQSHSFLCATNVRRLGLVLVECAFVLLSTFLRLWEPQEGTLDVNQYLSSS